MKVRMLYVYQSVKDKSGRPGEAGQRPTLCFKGRVHMLGVSVGYPVRVIKRPVRDFDVLRACPNLRVGHEGEEYSVQEAVEKLRAIAERNGITLGASKLLDHALKAASVEIDEDEYENEEELLSMETVKDDGDADESKDTSTEVTAVTEDGAKVAAKTAKKKSAKVKSTTAVKVTSVTKNAKVDPKPSKPVKSKAVKPLKAVKAAKKDKAPKKEKGPSLRELTVTYIKERLAGVDKDKRADREWRQTVVEAAHKKTGLSEISCRSVLRQVSK